jgi:hypothetical protein
MSSQELAFRQVHLDFHTSPDISGIGTEFNKQQFQTALKAGHVDSITLFAKCHHGWSYFDSEKTQRHPHLDFDLLSAQIEACQEIGVRTPIYVSAGLDDVIAEAHPEWREVTTEGKYGGWSTSPLEAGFKMMCFRTPYLDLLVEQVEEVAQRFSDCHGIFLDIIHQWECCCPWCMKWMKERDLDASKAEDRQVCARDALETYYERITAACRSSNPDMPIFHNSGHVQRGQRQLLEHFSHLELESLPTGGWGYDHFPLSAKHVQTLGIDFLGMTGKFHTTWGEFGGYKHPNALRYECGAMLAYGAKCSIGDQLPPSGEADISTYRLIGKAYAEVEAKEPWCTGVESVADIGLLSSRACTGEWHTWIKGEDADYGAVRLLLDGGFLFDVLDMEADFGNYKMLILPDECVVSFELEKKLRSYVDEGGKLLLSGTSGLRDDQPIFDCGASFKGTSEFRPDFILADKGLRPDGIDSPLVMYCQSQRMKLTDGASLGDIYDPHFNRTYEHYCSHQHAPPKTEPSGFICGSVKGPVMHLAHAVFTQYRAVGASALKDYASAAILLHLGSPTASTALPSTGRFTLFHQPEQGRHVMHLLYAPTVLRGSRLDIGGGTTDGKGRETEIIEDFVPLYDIDIEVGLNISRAVLQPQGLELQVDNGTFTVPEFKGHQLVELT